MQSVIRRFGGPVALQLLAPAIRAQSTSSSSAPYTAIHFKLTPQPHPLKNQTWKNPTQNHVWTDEEAEAALSVKPHLEPKTFGDRLIYAVIRGAYHTFNFCTRYNKKDPTAESVVLRLLFLESIAGVPGMVAASIRHFRSLRTMKRDHGWIHTLLEEAENERMHLLVFMKLFQPSLATRMLVIAAQGVVVTLLTGTYVIYPKALHRFVGYLEETAVDTYSDVIRFVETPGTKLNIAWKDLPAPDIAKSYWKLPDNATFTQVLKHVGADETHHRDVNHTLASLDTSSTNPFVLKHLEDAAAAYRSPHASQQ